MDYLQPAALLQDQINRSIAQIPNPPDPMEQALKKARLDQIKQAEEHERQRQANLTFDNNMRIFNALGADLPDGGHQFLNAAVKAIAPDFDVPPEMTQKGGKMLKLIAEAITGGEVEQAKALMDTGTQAGIFRSTKDLNEAARLQQVIRKDQAQRTAELVTPISDYARQAEDRLTAFFQGNNPYFGTDQEQLEARMRDNFAIAQSRQQLEERDRMRRTFVMFPNMMQQAMEGTMKQALDPKARALDRIATLSRKEPSTLSPEERRELESSVLTYGDDSMRQMFQVQSERANAALLNKQLADIQNRRETLNQAFALQGQAQADAGEITAGFQGYKDGLGANPTVEEVTGARIQLDGLNTRLTGAEQAYRQATAGSAQFLQQETAKAQATAQELRVQAQQAAPSARQMMLERADEADAVAKSSQAAHRLVTDLNPYAMARLEANIAILHSEVSDRKAHGADLEDVDKQLEAAQALLTQKQKDRDEAQSIVQAEQLRMLQREKVTAAKFTEAQRKAQKEADLNVATDAALRAIENGQSVNAATVQVFKDFKGAVALEDLRKQVMPQYEGILITKAQRAMGAAVEAFHVANKREPNAMELNTLANRVMAQHPGIKREEIVKGIMPNSLDVHVVSSEERGKIAETRAAIGRIAEIERGFKPEYVGFLDKKIGNIQQFFSQLPQEQADWYASVEQYGIEQRHRIFGSALTKIEKASALAAIPNAGMSDQEFKAAIKESKKWEERILGERTGVAEEVGVKAPLPIPKLSPKKQQMFDQLRQANPSEDVQQILNFLGTLPD